MKTSDLVGWIVVAAFIAVMAAYYTATATAASTTSQNSLERLATERRVELLAKQVEANKKQIADLRALIESLTLVVNQATKHKKPDVTTERVEARVAPSRVIVDTTFMRDELHAARRELNNLRSDLVHARARLSSARSKQGSGRKGAKADVRDWERRVRRLDEHIDAQQVKISRHSREIDSVERRNRFIQTQAAKPAK